MIIIKQKKKIKTYLGLASRAPAITLPISPVHVMGPFSSLWAFVGRRWLLWAFLGLVVIKKLKMQGTLRKRPKAQTMHLASFGPVRVVGLGLLWLTPPTVAPWVPSKDSEGQKIVTT